MSNCKTQESIISNSLLSSNEMIDIQKPVQYLGGELNSIIKDSADVSARIALAFPDTYEVGMSHVGMQILYDLINKDDRAWGERAYMPFPDMEQKLRDKKAPLYSLESKTPLSQFDALGFSLQYELCGTNILTMLDLAGIPAFASQRGNAHPLIIGGGPYSYHPEALAPFFDIFFLGDAEEFIPELIDLLVRHKNNKTACIEALSSGPGIYVPNDFTPHYSADLALIEIEAHNPKRTSIERRLLPSLENAPFPKKPVVPNMNIVHNRLSVEVMRGCVRGCRFCQAGYLYRPQRERSPKEVLDLVKDVLPSTGYEEVSLLSLSTADYCSIVPLLKSMMDRYGEGETLSVSFPSTRVDALTPEVLEQVQRVRRTNFTIAPEGGSQRLRDVINKGVTDEQIIETCTNVFTMGWTGIKLYFMMGLPTETDEDLEAIIELAERLKKLPVAKGKDITVSVSTHVPKPHTPFQWAEQITPEETLRKHKILAHGLKRAGVNFRYHDPFSSFLEGIFCRGGRELSSVVYRAYELGARLDSWQDHLREDVWMQAFKDCGISPYSYLRERDLQETLPWDHLSCGIPKSYFEKEYKRALRTKTTSDCLKTSCSVCGACDYDVRKNILWPRAETENALAQLHNQPLETLKEAPIPKLALRDASCRIRIRYAKNNIYRMLGHLELSTIFHRASRRASLPVAYSQGFHPHPKMSFSPPLPLGVSSRAEYIDISFYKEIDLDETLISLRDTLPDGLTILSGDTIPLKAESLQSSIVAQRYTVSLFDEHEALRDITENTLLEANVSRNARLKRSKSRKSKRNKDKTRVFYLRDYLSDISISPLEMSFTISMKQGAASPSPLEVLSIFNDVHASKDMYIEKIETFFKDKLDADKSLNSFNTLAVNY